jgi:hypothetical protein
MTTLTESTQEFERQLLESARADSVPESARRRVAGRLGLSGIAALAPDVLDARAAPSVSAVSSSAAKPALIGLASSIGVLGLVFWSLGHDAPSTRLTTPAPTEVPAALAPVLAVQQFVDEPASAPSSEPPAALPVRRDPAARPARRRSPAVGTLSPAPAAQSTRALGSDQLLEEVRQLDRARGDLAAGNASMALAVLDDYERFFPAGQLVLEAAVLRASALERAGRHAESEALARRLLARSDSGRYRSELTRLLVR